MLQRYRIVGLAATGMGLVASASAAIDINGTIGPILDSMIELIPTIIKLDCSHCPGDSGDGRCRFHRCILRQDPRNAETLISFFLAKL